MNGGRKRWDMDGRAWSRDPEPQYPRGNPIRPKIHDHADPGVSR